MPEVLAGKYVLEREIGRGGMGIVWMAYDQQLKRRVSIKFMTPERIVSPSAKDCFEREAQAIARLRNRHVVQIHDYGIHGDMPFMVMELLEGEDFESLLRRRKQFSFEETMSIIPQVLRGTAAAHAAGLIHLDLKPANFFLARIDGEESVKILDFGIATIVESAGAAARHGAKAGCSGTPAYMSPEQIRGASLDHRSDLWSLAVVAYELLTGRTPFDHPSLRHLLMQICGDSFILPSTLASDLPPGIDRFFERALAKDPAQRFQLASEMAAAYAALRRGGQRQPIKILVVDDELDMVELIRDAFQPKIRSAAYSFLFAHDGLSALDQLRQHPDIDIVLTDISMPGMDGLTLLSRISEVSPTAKAIVLTAYGDMRNIRTAMNRGAFDFLVKPYDFEDLESTIEKTFRHIEESRSSARFVQELEYLRMFVSPILVERIRLLGMDDDTGSEALDATVSFIDVCGSSAMLERLVPAEALRTLNANFDVIVPEIVARGGVVDRFVGGAVMAVFVGSGHVDRAVDASVAIRQQLQEMARRAGDDSPYACGVCIGIASGQGIAARIGTKAFRRLDYTLIGEVVTAAARLSNLADRGQILLNSAVREAATGALLCEDAGRASLTSGGELVPIYHVVRRAPPFAAARADEPTVEVWPRSKRRDD